MIPLSNIVISNTGAARTVTGSMHWLEAAGKTVLLDCGQIQGSRLDEELNRVPLPVGRVDAVVLSHAHIDHSGRLPLLRKQGFTGPIYTHPATRDLCAIMLPDAAYLHEKDGPGIRCIVPAGGLVTALDPVMRVCDGLWIAHGSGEQTDRPHLSDSRDRLGARRSTADRRVGQRRT